MHVGLTYKESELIDRLKDKDHQAFTYLYDKYAAILYCIVVQIVRKEEKANEVLSDVFISICREIHTYDNAKGRLLTWMMQIAGMLKK